MFSDKYPKLLSDSVEYMEQHSSPNGKPTVTVEWWDDPRQDVDAAERPCDICHGRGVDRWHDDCGACGGLGVLWV